MCVSVFRGGGWFEGYPGVIIVNQLSLFFLFFNVFFVYYLLDLFIYFFHFLNNHVKCLWMLRTVVINKINYIINSLYLYINVN